MSIHSGSSISDLEAESPDNIYYKLLDIINFISNNNYILTVNDYNSLKNIIQNLKTGKICYNKNSALLNYTKKCSRLELGVVETEVEKLYQYALKYDILMAPKTVTFGINIQASKYFL